MDRGDVNEGVIPYVRPNFSCGDLGIGDAGHALPAKTQTLAVDGEDRGEPLDQRRSFARPRPGDHVEAGRWLCLQALPKIYVRLRIGLLRAAIHRPQPLPIRPLLRDRPLP